MILLFLLINRFIYLVIREYNMKDLSEKIKKYRKQKGLSQAELAERSGLNLRTVQRIENGETIPRGDSLQRLTNALGIAPDELTNCDIIEDKNFLLGMNLSALSFIIFPLLGFSVPLIVWLSRKERVQESNLLAKRLLNFQLTWSIALFAGLLIYVLILGISFNNLPLAGDISPTQVSAIIKSKMILFGLYCVFLYLYNLTITLINAQRISKNKTVRYIPAIKFMKVPN